MTEREARATATTLIAELFQSYRATMPVQVDANVDFPPPKEALWGRAIALDGSEARSSASARRPIVVMVDAFAPQGSGDGDAVAAIGVVREGLRGWSSADGLLRHMSFREGPEGKVDNFYRKQLQAVFWWTIRV